MTMRNDATRLRISTKDQRRPRAVVARQGQVLLDTDVDEGSRHQLERMELETLDTLGSPGRFLVPAGTHGFEATADGASNVGIAAGRGYLDGWLLENPAACNLTTQPHPRAGDGMALPVVVGVKALIRHVDPVEEPALADVALGDAQASGRSLVDWQVLPLSLSGAGLACATATADPTWQALVAPSTGTLTVIEPAAAPSTDPCSLTPGGGYTRLENLLYRIEVHGGDVNPAFPTVDGPRFKLNNLQVKLSRRNASVMVRIVTIAGSEIQVAPAALDPRSWFAPGLYAEIVSTHDDVDPRAALAVKRLFRVALASDDRVTLEATPAEITASGATTDGSWFLRLWDAFADGGGVAVATVTGNAGESAAIDLGDGLGMTLGKGGQASAGTFRRGDYWTFAARADGTIDWPKTGVTPQAMTPHGPEVRYAPLAVMGGTGPSPVEDCRVPFAALSDQVLLYRGGDGQSVLPEAGVAMVRLPAPLRVGVVRGVTPVAGATVRWSVVGPAGRPCVIDGSACDSANPVDRTTDANGLVEVPWSIDATPPLGTLHQVQAALVGGSGVTNEPPVVFTATFNTADQVGYTTEACGTFAGIDNVGGTLDKLVAFACNPPASGDGAGCCHTVGRVADQAGEYPDIGEAIRKLREVGHRSICLCLLPGDHELDPGLLKQVLEGITDLVLSGRGATLVVPDALVFSQLERVAIRELRIISKSSQALAFVGSGKPPMDVELTDVLVVATEPRPGSALVAFADCGRVRLQGSDLRTASPGLELRDLMPARLAAIVEMVDAVDSSVVAASFATITALAEGPRKSLVNQLERSISTHRDGLGATEAAALDRLLAAVQRPAPPAGVIMSRLLGEWRRLGEAFGPRDRGWPVAILLVPASEGAVPAEADVVIEGCRISGGVMLGGPERDVDAEIAAESWFIELGRRADMVPEGSGRLQLVDNDLGWLAIGADQARRIHDPDVEAALQGLLFESALVSGNTFTGAPLALVAGAVTLHGNVFGQARPTSRFDRSRVGFAAAAAVSATGNIGPAAYDRPTAQLTIRGDADAEAEAGNARLFMRLA